MTLPTDFDTTAVSAADRVPILQLVVGERDDQDHFRVHILAMHDVRPDLEPRAPGRAASQVQSMVDCFRLRFVIEAAKEGIASGRSTVERPERCEQLKTIRTMSNDSNDPNEAYGAVE